MSSVLCNRPQRVRPYITSNGRLKTDYGNGELKIQHNDFKWFLVVKRQQKLQNVTIIQQSIDQATATNK